MCRLLYVQDSKSWSKEYRHFKRTIFWFKLEGASKMNIYSQ